MSVRRVRTLPTIVLLVCLLGASVLVSLATGASGFGFHPSAQGDDRMDTLILSGIRLPRIVFGVLVGASLGAAGGVMQGLFRNPLADPGLIGVSSGAALGVTLMIVEGPYLLGHWVFGQWIVVRWGMPIGGFVGALVMTAMLQIFAARSGSVSTTRLVLAGVALGALASALTGVLIYRASDPALRDLTFWSMGSLSGVRGREIGILAPFVLVALLIMVGLSRALNLLLAGEENAALMGCAVTRTKWLCLLGVTLSVGPAVAFAGVIAFVGVIVPHLVRLISGPDHRVLVPASALLGAILLVLADMLARILASPADMPIGIVTAALGAPVFIWILSRTRDHELPS